MLPLIPSTLTFRFVNASKLAPTIVANPLVMLLWLQTEAYALQVIIANSCFTHGGTNDIEYKYNMP
jgi:hypothetical protein